MAEFIKRGDFAGLITLKNCNGFEFEECERYYNAIDTLGPDAWEFIKQYPLFFEQADKNSLMYRKILDVLTDSGIEHDFSQEPGMPIMGNMWHIAKFGWTSFATAVLNR